MATQQEIQKEINRVIKEWEKKPLLWNPIVIDGKELWPHLILIPQGAEVMEDSMAKDIVFTVTTQEHQHSRILNQIRTVQKMKEMELHLDYMLDQMWNGEV